MRRPSLLLLLSPLLFAVLSSHAETTPLDQAIPEEQETMITCEYTGQGMKGIWEDAHVNLPKGTYHYKLWLPKGYHAEPNRSWPCLFIASPGGNASLGGMAERAKKGRYIAVSLVESRNDVGPPSHANFCAAHDDAVNRVRIQEGVKVATGMSGGARISSSFIRRRPGFAGIILQAAAFGQFTDGPKKGKYNVDNLTAIPGFVVALTMGKQDFNRSEVPRFPKDLPASIPYRLFEFEGGHDWAPPQTFSDALDWVERQIYVERPARTEMKPAYAAYFADQVALWEGLTDPWEKYQTGAKLLEIVRARSLTMDKTVGAKAATVQTETARLRNDPTITKEALASDSWNRLSASFAGSNAAKIAADCRDFAKRYPNTRAAKAALAKAGIVQ